MKVWYKLDDHQSSSLMFEDANVEDLKQAIKTVWGDQLHCPYPLRKVYPADTLLPVQPDTNFLNPGDPIQTVTSSRRPLSVIAPVQEPSSQQQNGKLTLVVLMLLYSSVPLEYENARFLEKEKSNDSMRVFY